MREHRNKTSILVCGSTETQAIARKAGAPKQNEYLCKRRHRNNGEVRAAGEAGYNATAAPNRATTSARKRDSNPIRFRAAILAELSNVRWVVLVQCIWLILVGRTRKWIAPS